MRAPIVTRRIRCTKYKVRCVDLKENKIFFKDIYIYERYPDFAAVLRAIERNKLAGSGVKAVSIESAQPVCTYRKMDIETYLKYSEEIVD